MIKERSVTSGRKLKARDVDAILQRAGRKRTDGRWLLSYKDIAAELDLNERTVRRWIRKAAVKLGQLSSWKPDKF